MHSGEQFGRVSTYGKRDVNVQVQGLIACVSVHRYYTIPGAFTADAKWPVFLWGHPTTAGVSGRRHIRFRSRFILTLLHCTNPALNAILIDASHCTYRTFSVYEQLATCEWLEGYVRKDFEHAGYSCCAYMCVCLESTSI